jgi:hypothetical protein
MKPYKRDCTPVELIVIVSAITVIVLVAIIASR